MNATTIAQELKVSVSAIREVQEWAKVCLVIFHRGLGLRPRFVAKRKVKNNMEMTRKHLAEKIAEDLDCTSKVWTSSDNAKVRVYLSHRGKNYGFVEVNLEGVEFFLSGYAQNAYGSDIRNSIKDVVISEPKEVIPGVRKLTQDEVVNHAQYIEKRIRRSHNDDEYYYGAADEESF